MSMFLRRPVFLGHLSQLSTHSLRSRLIPGQKVVLEFFDVFFRYRIIPYTVTHGATVRSLRLGSHQQLVDVCAFLSSLVI